MTHRIVLGARLFVRSLFKSTALLLALAIVGTSAETALAGFTVGPKEVIYTKKQRSNKKLGTWPDGNMGVVNNGNGAYDFYGANGTSPVRTSGTLANPGGSKKSVKISNVPKKAFNYVSGGPIFQDPDSGTRMMLYHAEKHGKNAKDYYSVLGLAVCLDPNGLNFTDLGTIIEPNIPQNQTVHSIDIGGGSLVMKDGYLNVYYRDYLADGNSAELAVARASVSDVMSNAFARQGTTFNKYYNGTWTELGRGGKASPLEIGNPSNAWSSVSYNDYLDQMVMVSSQWTPTQPDLYMATSSDGLNWSPRQALDLGSGEQFYPSIVGTGADASQSGQSFYVYYTDSQKGAWNRWKDAALVRRKVTFDSINSPTTPSETEDGPPAPTEWALVSDFRNDFQAGTPADGWSYVWNPTGKLENSAAFVPLQWSAVDGVYNTTGGGTAAPAGKKSHNDDYLHLRGNGVGHPGKPSFMPIAGYTVQDDDGAGEYRLADSLIAKIDGITSSGEDGLEVKVYVNNSLIGSTIGVSTNGSLANFDRVLGELNVGDTVWVAINALTNQNYDSFTGFDFSIERAVPLQMMSMMAAGGGQVVGAAVPEPGTACLLLVAAMLGCLRRRRQTC